MKKILYGVFLGALALLSLVYIFGGFSGWSTESPLLNGIFMAGAVLLRVNLLWIGLVIFLENKNPDKTLSWLLVLILLPVLGFVLYVLFGRSYRKKKKVEAKTRSNSHRMERAAAIQDGLLDYMMLPNSESPANKRLMQLLLRSAKAPFSLNNEVEILTNGIHTFGRLFEAIEQARDHIHLEYFIIKDDVVGNQLRELLIRKAQEGVEVRVLYDDVGSISLGRSYVNSLKDAGVQVACFFEVLFPVLSRDLNYRNHRKIAVIDGEIGFLGGLNIGDEYAGPSKRFSFWRDTHLAVKGEAVYALQTIFLNDWNYILRTHLDDIRYYPENRVTGQSLVQIVASGPDAQWKSMLQAFYMMTANASEKLWIVTPYLVPEDSILMGLKTAALGGVDVRIIIPSVPDHFFVYWSSQSYIQELLEAGVRVYRYKNGFVHAKIVLVDRLVATVGTANLDIRSMEINFEVNAFLYDVEVIVRLETDFLRDFEDSELYSLERFQRRSLYRRFMESVGRLVSPLQ